jgi:hypothetical protein
MVRQFCWVALLLCSCFVPLLPAGTVSYSYFSGDLRNNATVTGCGPSCTLGVSDTDAVWAQWAAAVYPFTVTSTSTMYAVTFGWGGGTSGTGAVVLQGGLEPYLSLFDSTGSFLASTYSGTYCPPGANTIGGQCDDVRLDGGTLAPGSYEIALSAFWNMSFAENLGSGMLADGFTGLGNLAPGENLNYAFDVVLTSSSPGPTDAPEPGCAPPLAAVAAAFLWSRRSFLRRSTRTR